MAWIDAEPPARTAGASGSVKDPVAVGIRGARAFRGGRRRPAELALLIRPHLVGRAPSWLTRGARVQVRFGTGADEGAVLIAPNGGHPVTTTASRAGTPAPLVIVARLPLGVAPDARQAVGVSFSIANDLAWIRITLPGWARGQLALPSPEQQPAPAPVLATAPAAEAPPRQPASPPGTAMAKALEAAREMAKPKSGGFVSISNRTPDPAAARRDPRELERMKAR